MQSHLGVPTFEKKNMSDWASKYFKQFYTRISKMFISYDSGKCPIMWKLYLAYLVNFAEEAGLVEFAGDLSGQKIKMGFVFWVQKLSLWEIHQNLKWAPLQSHRLVSNLTIALIFIVCIGLYRFWKCINASLWPQRTKRMEVSSFTT